jgi:hypothetical protein
VETVDAINWLIDPAVLPRATGQVWHYTDTAGLLGILSTNTLWASVSTHLNDEAELRHGIGLMQQTLAKFASHPNYNRVGAQIDVAEAKLLYDQTFVLSASLDGDSLSQWRGYAGVVGYAVGLAADEPLDLLDATGFNPTTPEEGDIGDVWQSTSAWRAVLYDPEAQEEAVATFVELMLEHARPTADDGRIDPEAMLIRAWGQSAYAAIVACIKHPAFVDEREVRLVATARDIQRFHHLRAGTFGPTPFVKLTGVPRSAKVERASYAQREGCPLPIVEVRAGPSPHAKTSMLGAERALKRYGYTEAVVSPSLVPFR